MVRKVRKVKERGREIWENVGEEGALEILLHRGRCASWLRVRLSCLPHFRVAKLSENLTRACRRSSILASFDAR